MKKQKVHMGDWGTGFERIDIRNCSKPDGNSSQTDTFRVSRRPYTVPTYVKGIRFHVNMA